MKVDLYLRWLFYVELAVLIFLSLPIGLSLKRSVLGAVAPLLSKIQLFLVIIWGAVGFIFATTFYEAFQYNSGLAASNTVANNNGTFNSSDFTQRIQGIESERDAMLSFTAFLLFPLIKIHSSFILKEFRLEQSQIALKKQATQASNLLKTMMVEKEEKSKSTKSKATDKDKDKEKDFQMTAKEKSFSDQVDALADQVDALQTKLEISNQQRDQYKQELELTKEKVQQLDQMDKVVKKKA